MNADQGEKRAAKRKGEGRSRDQIRREETRGPLDVRLMVNGEEVAMGQAPVSAPLLFTANDCLDIGTDLGSPVSLDYYDKKRRSLSTARSRRCG